MEELSMTMKKQFFYYITAYMTIAFVLATTAPYVYATTIVNSISVHSSTGGQFVSGTDGEDGQDGKGGKNGQDGQDGKNGEDGADGKDGQSGKSGQDGHDGQKGKIFPPPQTNVSVSVKSQVNGVTVFESDKNKNTKINVPLYVASVHATSTNNSVIEVYGSAHTSAVTGLVSTHAISVQELFKTIHLIMKSYVSKLF
jgi:hypothetical protein